MRLLSSFALAALLSSFPSSLRAATTVVDTEQELSWLSRQKRIEGSVVVRMPGLQTLSLPKLVEVTERLEIAVTDLASVSLPRLQRVGSDLSMGCHHSPRDQWEVEGPLRPLREVDLGGPSFAAGPPVQGGPTEAPGGVSLPALLGVGGGLALCAPRVQGLDAPKLETVGTDLQLFAGPGWSEVALPALSRVRGGVFVWLAEADLSVEARALTQVNGAVQGGGQGTLRLRLPKLEQTAGLALTGSRETASGPGDPSLVMAALDLSSLRRTSQLLSLRTLTGLTELRLGLSEAGSVVLQDLPDLAALSIPELAALPGDLVLRELPGLGTLELPALASVGGRVQLAALGMQALTLPPLESVELLLVEDCALSSFVAPTLRSAGRVVLRGLGPIEEVAFPELREVRGMLTVSENLGGEAYAVAPRRFSAPKLARVGESSDDRLQISEAAFTVLSLPSLEQVAGGLVLAELPSLTLVELGQLQAVLGRMVVQGAPQLEQLAMPSLRKAESLELVGLTGLRRVSARQLDTTVRQTSGTRVAALDVGAR